MPKTYEPIASQTLGSAIATVTFSDIPVYTDLIAVVSGKVTSTTTDLLMRVGNGSVDAGSNYSRTYLLGTGSIVQSARTANTTSVLGGNLTTSDGSYCIYQIMSYANTNVNKTILSSSSQNGGWVSIGTTLWRSNSAINIVSFFNNSSITFASGSTFSLYGIKAA